MRETRKRTVAKTLTWRMFAICVIGLISSIMTGSLTVAASIVGLDTLLKSIAYLLHERLWARSHWGYRKGKVIWFTGLSGAGKSTITQGVSKRLDEKNITHVILDGDELRKLFPNVGFSKEDRDAHVQRVGHVASLLAEHGAIVLCSLISPYAETRQHVRETCDDFIEVFVKCPIDTCIQRDVKGLYRKALAGEIKQFTGISDPYEEPVNPEIVLETDKLSIDQCVRRIMREV